MNVGTSAPRQYSCLMSATAKSSCARNPSHRVENAGGLANSRWYSGLRDGRALSGLLPIRIGT
jgi:hypothetical protein